MCSWILKLGRIKMKSVTVALLGKFKRNSETDVCDYNPINIQVIYNKTRKNKSEDHL